MKTINLKTLSTDIGIGLVKKSQKITIRDVDEETKNHFVAYADENDQSFDVSITLDTNQNVIETSCDCEIAGICMHKIALIAQLATSKSKPVVSRTKKSSPAETLVNCLEDNELREWVIDLLKTNKEIEFLFINKFAIVNEDFTKPDIKKLIQDAIKSVVKTRKKIETNELKKIIDVFEISLKPVTNRLLTQFYHKESTELLLYLFETLIDFDNNLYSNSVKVIRFFEKIAKQFIDYLSILNDDTAWFDIIDYHFEFILSTTSSRVESGIFLYLKKIYSETTAQNRKLYFAKKLEDYYIQVSKKYTIESEVNMFILQTNIDAELFSSSFFHFKCHRFHNEYNLIFIDNLIKINQLELAKKYCEEQINSNYQSDYDIPYLQRLKIILKSQNNNSQLAKVLMLTILFELDFEDYVFIVNNTPDDVFKKFKTTFMASVKRKFEYGPEYSSIYFKILAFDKRYKKMLESIDQFTDYDIIYPHREDLYELDPFTFLYNLANVETNNYRSKKYEYNQEYRQKLIDWFFEEKQKESVNLFYKNRLHLRFNSKFFDTIALKLHNENLNLNN